LPNNLRCTLGRSLAALVAAAVLAGMPSSWAAAPPSPRPQASLQQLDEACQAARQRGALQSLRLLQRNLLQVSPAPQPLPVVLANADALLRCGAPDGALVVLNRYSPAAGAEQIQWSMLQWRAAAAALDHRLAAEALRQLALASGRSLEALQVPVGQDAKGRWQNQIALDLLAGHLDALGQRQQAAQLLLSSRTPGVVSAQRLAQAVAWAGATMPLEERQRWLEKALDQAAAAGAWGLAAALLDQQLALFEQPSPQRLKLEERRRRLGRRLDDSQAVNPAAVRSPRDPGGHAAAPQP